VLDPSSLRDDCVDFTLASLWEIKPVASARLGVVQEFYYRHSYNLYAALLNDLHPSPFPTFLQCVPPRLRAGGAWPRPQPEPMFCIDPRISGHPLPVLLYPVQSSLLPGVVLYLVIRTSRKMFEKLAQGIQRVLDTLAEEVKKLADEVKRWWDRELQPVFAKVAGSAIVAVIGAALTALLSALARAGPRLQPPPAVPSWLVVPPAEGQLGGPDPHRASLEPADVGVLTIAGLRVADDVLHSLLTNDPPLQSQLEQVLDDALKAAVAAIEEEPAAGERQSS
jgi:hypothetical protein